MPLVQDGSGGVGNVHLARHTPASHLGSLCAEYASGGQTKQVLCQQP